MDVTRQAREERKKELLTELAELMVQEQAEQGVFLETPHYSIIERQAVTLGRELSRQAQERAAREIAAHCDLLVACPDCQSPCEVETQTREVMSIDGPVALTETIARCDRCRRSFFPSAGGSGNR
jgi:hypothetical protein